MQQVRAAGR